MRLKDIDFTRIHGTLMPVYDEAERIRNDIKLGNLSVKDAQFFVIIENLLTGMGFQIHYTDILHNFKFNNQELGHIPSITIYSDQYHKELGGDIYIYDKYSTKKKRELLIHELIHIEDRLTPTWSTNNTDTNNVFMLSIHTLRRVELFTELTALALMMPINSLQHDLFDCSYDINKIISDYKAIETNTVIMWIIIHDYFYAHYAMLFQIKDSSGQDVLFRIDEHSNADSKFDIANIVLNKGSIAYKSWCDKQSQSGESMIDNKDYQCFCFYEKNVKQPLPSDVSSIEMIVECDKMVIVGWSKHIFDFIQRLEFKQNSTSDKNL